MDSPANGTSARGSPADERLVSRVFRVFVSRPRKALSRPVFYSLKNEVLAPQGFTSTQNRRGTMRHGFRHRS